MAAAIELRGDFTGDDLRRLARASRDAKQVRRLLALAVICEGGTRTEAARVGGVGLQIVRDWVVRFNAEGPEGLIDRKAPGKAPTLTPEHRAALARRRRGWPRALARRRGALAADRPRAMAVGRVPGVGERGDGGAGAAGARLAQALGAAAALRAGPGGGGRFQKSLPEARGGNRRRASRQAHRALVPGRGPDRPEEQAHPAVGAARHPTAGTTRPAHGVGLHLRRDLSGRGQGRRPRHAFLRHRGHAGASRRDQRHGRPGAHAVLILDQAGLALRRRTRRARTTSRSCRCRPARPS